MEKEILRKLSIYYKAKVVFNTVNDAFNNEALNILIHAYKSFTDPEIQPVSYESVTELYKKIGDIHETLCKINLYGITKDEYDEVLEEYRISQAVTGLLKFTDFIDIEIKILENYLKRIRENKKNEKSECPALDKMNGELSKEIPYDFGKGFDEMLDEYFSSSVSCFNSFIERMKNGEKNKESKSNDKSTKNNDKKNDERFVGTVIGVPDGGLEDMELFAHRMFLEDFLTPVQKAWIETIYPLKNKPENNKNKEYDNKQNKKESLDEELENIAEELINLAKNESNGFTVFSPNSCIISDSAHKGFTPIILRIEKNRFTSK